MLQMNMFYYNLGTSKHHSVMNFFQYAPNDKFRMIIIEKHRSEGKSTFHHLCLYQVRTLSIDPSLPLTTSCRHDLGKSIALSGMYFLHNEKVVTSKISLSSKMSMIL